VSIAGLSKTGKTALRFYLYRVYSVCLFWLSWVELPFCGCIVDVGLDGVFQACAV